MPAQEPPWPASCLVSPRASCPRVVAGPGVRTARHRSRALRRPARRPPGSASSTSRACAGPLRSLTALPASRSWVALCPLRASRLRGRGFARYAATPPPSGTPLLVRGRRPPRCLPSLNAPPPSLRFGRLRWPAPCGPSRPWQDGQGSIPARRWAPSRLSGPGCHMAAAVNQGGASRCGLILVAGFGGQASRSGSGNIGAIARHPWQTFAAPAFALNLRGRPGRLRSARSPRKPRWRFAHYFGWRSRALHPGWLVRVGGLAGIAPGQASPAARPPQAVHGKPSRLLPWSAGAERAPCHLPAPRAAPHRWRFAHSFHWRGATRRPLWASRVAVRRARASHGHAGQVPPRLGPGQGSYRTAHHHQGRAGGHRARCQVTPQAAKGRAHRRGPPPPAPGHRQPGARLGPPRARAPVVKKIQA